MEHGSVNGLGLTWDEATQTVWGFGVYGLYRRIGTPTEIAPAGKATAPWALLKLP